jgi:hypothetical protein
MSLTCSYAGTNRVRFKGFAPAHHARHSAALLRSDI